MLLASIGIPSDAAGLDERGIQLKTEGRDERTMQLGIESLDERTIQLGTEGLDSVVEEVVMLPDKHYNPQDYLYLGKADGLPLKWRVLDAKKIMQGKIAEYSYWQKLC